jgi:3'-phosphoadenosine 5'-phosphosulfate sulfotransferase (PAPS reductase)/FAD synthetase
VLCLGGGDSDIILDLCEKCKGEASVDYVWFDTGLEYEATKRHLDDLEQKYGIEIKREKAIKPIPLTCKEYGQPFLSKFVSEMMMRLQKKGFQWEDEPLEVLEERYPHTRVALRWWCNNNNNVNEGYQTSMFNIDHNKYLKEFIMENPPTFKISNLCCKYAKKEVSKKYEAENDIGLTMTGIRKAEGGVRAAAIKGCFSHNDKKADQYRPIVWFSNTDKKEYKEKFGIVNSDCYEKWGFKRTGCVGCPYNLKIEHELETVKEREPKLYNAVMNVFKDTYEYTRKYREFVKNRKENKNADQN